MTYKEESFVLNTLRDIAEETHENNIMLRQIIQYLRGTLSKRKDDEEEDFGRNVMANIMSEVFDGIKSKIKR